MFSRIVAASLLGASLVAVPMSASAAESCLGVVQGNGYVDFTAPMSLIPGRRLTSKFTVTNRGPSDGVLTVDVRDVIANSSPSLLAGLTSVTLGGNSTTLAAVTSPVVLKTTPLAMNASTDVYLDIYMDDSVAEIPPRDERVRFSLRFLIEGDSGTVIVAPGQCTAAPESSTSSTSTTATNTATSTSGTTSPTKTSGTHTSTNPGNSNPTNTAGPVPGPSRPPAPPVAPPHPRVNTGVPGYADLSLYWWWLLVGAALVVFGYGEIRRNQTKST